MMFHPVKRTIPQKFIVLKFLQFGLMVARVELFFKVDTWAIG